MFSWASGWHPGGGRARCALKPRDAVDVELVARAWVSGYEPRDVRSVAAEDCELSLAVIGPCLAEGSELRMALPVARAGRWAGLSRWPGSYLVLVQAGAETVVFG